MIILLNSSKTLDFETPTHISKHTIPEFSADSDLLVQTLRKIQRSFSDLEDQLGREPTREELSEHTQVPLEKLNELIRTYSQPSSGNAASSNVNRNPS